MKENIFINYSIADIHKKFLSKELDPVELANETKRLYDEEESKYFGWVCFSWELLLQEALRIKEDIFKGKSFRLLESIPVGVKDIFNTTDFPTEMGSPLWQGFTPGNDARVVFNLKNQGAIIPGKTVTAEFAVHTLGKTLNPHDITRTPGTSSSGSAVAVALGMVPVSLGTQTAGSIVRPASFCGVYGCKPSFGLVPRTGTLKTTDSLDTIGFFVSRYENIRPVFESIRVNGFNYPISHRAFNDPARLNKPEGRPWKVIFVKTHTWEYAPEYAKADIENYVQKLSSFKDIEVFETELPDEMLSSHIIHSTIYDKTLSYYFAEEYQRSELVSDILNNIIRNGLTITSDEYFRALEAQKVLCRKMDQFLSSYDIMISLSTAGEAPLRNVVEYPDGALMWTMTHLPVISIPQFISPSGLPYGMQVSSRKYNDYLLLKFTDYLRENDLIPEGVNPHFEVPKLEAVV